MKKLLVAVISLILMLSLTFGSSSGAEKAIIAVVDFGISEVTEEVSRKLTQKFRDVLSGSQLVNVASRDEVEVAFEKVDMLYKMKLEQIECQNESCAVKVGVSLGVDKTIIGKIIKDEKDKNCLIWVKLINVSKRTPEFIASVEGPLDADLHQLVTKLGQKVVNWLPKQGETEKQVKKRRIEQQQKEEEEKKRQREEQLKKLAYRKPGTCPKGMILVPAGEFVMGSNPSDPDRQDNEAANKRVMVKEFCIDKYEFPNQKGKYPMKKVTWTGGKNECEQLGKRLCTEVEWERACKGTKGFAYPYGNKFGKDKCNTAYMKGDKLTKPHIAKSGVFKDCVSGYGVADMSGNLWEWTADDYNPNIWSYVIRGGSHMSSLRSNRCATRRGAVSSLMGRGRKDHGFRCCK